MPNIRIKDIPTTASATSSTDFIAIDGATNGTRKLSADSPVFGGNVTVNGGTVGTAASTNLTLAGGSSGASLVLGQGASGTISSTATRASADYSDTITNSSTTGNASASRYAYCGSEFAALQRFGPSFGLPNFANKGGLFSSTGILLATNAGTSSGGTGTVDILLGGFNTTSLSYRFGPNLLIGGTTDITGSGGLKVFGTTASTSATTGALQVAGGVGIGGVLNVSTIDAAANFTSSNNFGTVVTSTVSVYNPQVSAFLSPNMLPFGVGNYSRNYFGVERTAYNSGVLMFSYAGAGSTSNSFGLAIYGQEPALRINGTGVVTVPSTTASTSTTTGALTVAGGVGVAGAGYFSGERINNTFSANEATRIQCRNDTSGTAAQAQVSATLGNFTTYTAMGSLSAGFTTSGLFAANSGYIASNATAGLNLFTTGATELTLGTNGTARMTIASGGDSTFSGAIAIGNTVNTVSPTSPDRTITMVIGGTTYYIHAKTTND
jgi:hypothetical protein